MKCPYCAQEMIAGTMLPMSPKYIDAIYWLPKSAKIHGLLLSAKKIAGCGGLIFADQPMSDGVNTSTPDAYQCPKCKILLTQFD